MKAQITLLFLSLTSFINAQNIYLEGDTANNYPYVKYFYDNYVLASGGFSNGTKLFDCTDPSNIIDISSVSVPGGTDVIQVNGNIVYSGGWMTAKVVVADFTNIYAPLTIGTLNNLVGLPMGIAVTTDYFYLSQCNDTLYVIDQTNMSNLTIVNKINIDAQCSVELIIYDTMLYAATTNGLKAIDISDPLNPQLVTTIGGSYYEINIDTINKRVFVSKGDSNGFDYFDVSDPYNISIISAGGSGFTGKGVAYYDNKIFQATQNGINNVVAVYDVSVTPPVMLDSHPIVAGTSGVTVKDSTFYVGDYANFSVFSFYHGANIESNILANSIKTFPNPVQNSMTVEIENFVPNKTNLILQNSQGNIVLSQNVDANNVSINLTDIEPGVYFLKVIVDDAEQNNIKLIKL